MGIKEEMKKHEEVLQTGHANYTFTQTETKVGVTSDVDITGEMAMAMVTELLDRVREEHGSEAVAAFISEVVVRSAMSRE
jgi:adenosylmethionine-8-amino-7-oxononanoate aminotransferase